MKIVLAFLLLISSRALAGGTGVIGIISESPSLEQRDSIALEYIGHNGSVEILAATKSDFLKLSEYKNKNIAIDDERIVLRGTISEQVFTNALVIKTDNAQEVVIFNHFDPQKD